MNKIVVVVSSGNQFCASNKESKTSRLNTSFAIVPLKDSTNLLSLVGIYHEPNIIVTAIKATQLYAHTTSLEYELGSGHQSAE